LEDGIVERARRWRRRPGYRGQRALKPLASIAATSVGRNARAALQRARSRGAERRALPGTLPSERRWRWRSFFRERFISCVVARVDARVRRLEAAPGAGAVSRNSRARFARASLDVPAGHLGHRVAPPRAGARDARRTRAQGGVLF
jgi:hypothetical protein